MREQFEEWAKARPYSLHRVGDEYKYMATQHAWLGWQASRAALCVDLPEVFEVCHYDDPEQLVLDDEGVIGALRAAGVRYK